MQSDSNDIQHPESHWLLLIVDMESTFDTLMHRKICGCMDKKCKELIEKYFNDPESKYPVNKEQLLFRYTNSNGSNIGRQQIYNRVASQEETDFIPPEWKRISPYNQRGNQSSDRRICREGKERQKRATMKEEKESGFSSKHTSCQLHHQELGSLSTVPIRQNLA